MKGQILIKFLLLFLLIQSESGKSVSDVGNRQWIPGVTEAGIVAIGRTMGYLIGETAKLFHGMADFARACQGMPARDALQNRLYKPNMTGEYINKQLGEIDASLRKLAYVRKTKNPNMRAAIAREMKLKDVIARMRTIIPKAIAAVYLFSSSQTQVLFSERKKFKDNLQKEERMKNEWLTVIKNTGNTITGGSIKVKYAKEFEKVFDSNRAEIKILVREIDTSLKKATRTDLKQVNDKSLGTNEFMSPEYGQQFPMDKGYKTNEDMTPDSKKDKQTEKWLKYLQDSQMRWQLMGKKIQDLKTLASQMDMLMRTGILIRT